MFFRSKSKYFHISYEETRLAASSLFNCQTKKQKHVSFDWASRFLDIAGLLEYLKVIPEESMKVDAVMTQLSQSSGASASELQAYFGEAAQSAQKYGVSVSDLIGITAEWSRMGYGQPDARALAETAALYSSITGMDPGASSAALASTMQGLQLEAGEVMQLLDMMARAGNDLSVDPAGIGRALQESEASFRAADTLAGDSLLKGILDLGNGAVNLLDFITDKLGVLGTLGTIGGAVAGAKGAGLT